MPRTRTSAGRRTLAPKEWACAKALIEAIETGNGKSARQCALDAGYAPTYASTAAAHVQDLFSTNLALRDIMERKGLTLESIADDLLDLRKATKHVVVNKALQEVPDNRVRLAGVKLRAQLHDAMPTPKLEIEKREMVYHVTIDPETIERIHHVKSQSIRGLPCPTDPALPPSSG